MGWGSGGRQVVVATAASIAISTRSTSAANGTGWINAQFNANAPPLTAPQKKLPTLSPNAWPLGTSILVSRNPSAHAIGASHCCLAAGPVGPLLMPFSLWPQRPWNASQAYRAEGDGGTSGRRPVWI